MQPSSNPLVPDTVVEVGPVGEGGRPPGQVVEPGEVVLALAVEVADQALTTYTLTTSGSVHGEGAIRNPRSSRIGLRETGQIP